MGKDLPGTLLSFRLGQNLAPSPAGATTKRRNGQSLSWSEWEEERTELVAALSSAGLFTGGRVSNKLLALQLVLRLHPYWRGCLAYNQMLRAYMCGDTRLDLDFITAVRCWFEAELGVGPTKDNALAAARSVAIEGAYHPVERWLSSLPPWDGEERIPELVRVLGAHHDKDKVGLYREYLRAWFVGAVRRIFVPGCQFDAMLVLCGAQGIKKSSFWSVLAGGAPFYNCLPSTHFDERYTIHAAWIHECAELEGVTTKADLSKIKAHITTRADNLTVKYEIQAQFWERRFVFVGTTNTRDFLRDTTDNRRFWIMDCLGDIDLPWVVANRDLLWAEALALHRGGNPAYLAEQWQVDAQRQLNQEYMPDDDAWEEEVENFLIKNQENLFITSDVLTYLGFEVTKKDWHASRRVGQILDKKGYSLQVVTKYKEKSVKRWKRKALPDYLTQPHDPKTL